MTRHHDLAWWVDRGGSVSRLRSPPTRYRFGTFTLRVLAPLLFATVAHAQPTTWQTYRDGSTTRYQGTDAKGGQWTGSSYEQWGMRFYEFTGPDGQTQRCRAYAQTGARNAECWP
jgi:hypothetical protein